MAEHLQEAGRSCVGLLGTSTVMGSKLYGKLDGAISGTSVIPVFTKVGIDQVLWNPIFGVMFFGYMGILEGRSISGTYNKIKNDLMTQVRILRKV